MLFIRRWPDSIWVWAAVESEWSERRGLVSYQVRENSILLSKNTSRWCMGHCWNLCQPISSKLPFEWLEFLNESLGVHPMKPRRHQCHYLVYRRLLATFWFQKLVSIRMDVCRSVGGWVHTDISQIYWIDCHEILPRCWCFPERMNPAGSADPLSEPLGPPSDYNITRAVKCFNTKCISTILMTSPIPSVFL